MASTQIVLAARDIEIGSVLKEEDVKLADWPGTVPTGASKSAEATRVDAALGVRFVAALSSD